MVTSPLVQLLHRVFAQPVENLGDVTQQLLAGPTPEETKAYMTAAAAPARQSSAKPVGPAPAAPSGVPCYAPGLSARDNSYFSRYYGPVAARAAEYGVNPAFVLGNGYESGYADPSIPKSTYPRTGDAFGMTGGSTANMTHAASPQQNVDQLFNNFGSQIRGVGDSVDAYVNALRGRDSSGAPVNGWQAYNQEGKNGKGDPRWDHKIRVSIDRMMREVPAYAQYCAPGAKKDGR